MSVVSVLQVKIIESDEPSELAHKVNEFLKDKTLEAYRNHWATPYLLSVVGAKDDFGGSKLVATMTYFAYVEDEPVESGGGNEQTVPD